MLMSVSKPLFHLIVIKVGRQLKFCQQHLQIISTCTYLQPRTTCRSISRSSRPLLSLNSTASLTAPEPRAESSFRFCAHIHF
eukprot:s6295_g2.t1